MQYNDDAQLDTSEVEDARSGAVAVSVAWAAVVWRSAAVGSGIVGVIVVVLLQRAGRRRLVRTARRR